MADSRNIDRALLTRLSSDGTLLAACPNGVYWDESPAGMTKFVIVSLITSFDDGEFGARAYQDATYLVEARCLNDNAACAAAEARIDELLEMAVLTATGYAPLTVHREERTRLTEVDDVDLDMRWYRGGGHYRVEGGLA